MKLLNSFDFFELKISFICFILRICVFFLNCNEEIKIIKIFLVYVNNCIINYLIYFLEYFLVVFLIDKFVEVLFSFVLVCSVVL